jgi:hypothetical protein
LCRAAIHPALHHRRIQKKQASSIAYDPWNSVTQFLRDRLFDRTALHRARARVGGKTLL